MYERIEKKLYKTDMIVYIYKVALLVCHSKMSLESGIKLKIFCFNHERESNI